MSYVYRLTETAPRLYTVGAYDPAGRWVTESDHRDPTAAADRTTELNRRPARPGGPSWCFIDSDTGRYTVGFFDPAQVWHPESDQHSKSAALARQLELNGDGPHSYGDGAGQND